ncbi:TetR/AcrR family transcriptional regulator [soil metagenome]
MAEPAPADADHRKRQPRGDARRQQIIDAAIELFAAKGFRGTGLAALAEQVGVTAPALLYHFGTKDRLLREVVEQRQVDERAALAAVPEPEVGVGQLHAVVRRTVEQSVLSRLYVVLGAENLDPGDPLHEFFVGRYDQARRAVRHGLALDERHGTVRAGLDVEQLAIEVVATLIGLEVQWLTDPTAFDLIAVVDAYVDRLLQELAP